jgi:hypothetical protein
LLQMVRLVVELSTLPECPDDLEPSVGQAAISVVLGVAVGSAAGEKGGGPLSFRKGADGELLSCMTKDPVAGFAKADTSLTTALDGDRTSAGEGLNEGRGREAVAMVTKHDEQFWGQEVAGTRERVKDRVVGVLTEELLGLTDLESFVADQVKKELGQEDSFAFVGRDDDGVGLRSGLGESGMDIGQEFRVGIVVGAAESGEIGVGEGLSGFWSGVSDEEEERELGFDITEEVEGLRGVA